MNRDEFPIEKPILLIQDFPQLNELTTDIPWSSDSNLLNLSFLREAEVTYDLIATTYLSYKRPFDKDFESQISPKETEICKIPFVFKEKTFFLEESLYKELMDLIVEIEAIKPKMIICFGKWSLFFLAKEIEYKTTKGTTSDPRKYGAISKFRGSSLTQSELLTEKYVIIPLYPSHECYRDRSREFFIRQDFNKVGEIYKTLETETVEHYQQDFRVYEIGDSVEKIRNFLQPAIELLNNGKDVFASVDIETRNYTIDCIGVSFNTLAGICIPFSLYEDPEPWSFDEEVEIFGIIYDLLKHPRLKIIGQNFGYDSAYFYYYFCLNKTAEIDTMIRHHTFFNAVPKSLDFLASLYCEKYIYWKNEREK